MHTVPVTQKADWKKQLSSRTPVRHGQHGEILPKRTHSRLVKEILFCSLGEGQYPVVVLISLQFNQFVQNQLETVYI